MVATLALLAAQCVPARWFSADPHSLDLLNGAAVNCLVVDQAHWSKGLVEEARRRGIKMLAVADSSWVPADADGLVATDARVTGKLPVILVTPRNGVHPELDLAATEQGVWPGLRVDKDAIATPSSAPWIDTNLGYLRYLRSQTHAAIWLFDRPPPGQVFPMRRYEQALSDAALAGAHWVIDPDDATARRLLAGDPGARKDWAELMALAGLLHSMPDVRALETYSRLGVSVTRETGALVSGGVLDMIGAQHIPFQVVKSGAGMQQFFDFADPAVVKFPKTSVNRVLIRIEDVEELEPIYREVQAEVGRTNFGLRVFNGAGVLSAPYALPENKGVVVLLVNYTDFKTEDITLHVQGVWKKATLEIPGSPPQPLNIYSVKTATAVEIPALDIFGVVRVE